MRGFHLSDNHSKPGGFLWFEYNLVGMSFTGLSPRFLTFMVVVMCGVFGCFFRLAVMVVVPQLVLFMVT